MNNTLVVYSTPLCAPCDSLKRILTSEGLDFEVKDLMIDEAAAETLRQHGIRSTPALGIGTKIYSGEELAPERLIALLGPIIDSAEVDRNN